MSSKTTTNRPEPALATKLRHAFAEHREPRQRKLAELLMQGARNNVLLVMMANCGYKDIFNNWVRSCDNNGLDVRSWALLFAVDEEAASNAEHQWFRTYIDALSYGEQPRDGVKNFGDRDFRKLMFQKTAVVQDILENGLRRIVPGRGHDLAQGSLGTPERCRKLRLRRPFHVRRPQSLARTTLREHGFFSAAQPPSHPEFLGESARQVR